MAGRPPPAPAARRRPRARLREEEIEEIGPQIQSGEGRELARCVPTARRRREGERRPLPSEGALLEPVRHEAGQPAAACGWQRRGRRHVAGKARRRTGGNGAGRAGSRPIGRSPAPPPRRLRPPPPRPPRQSRPCCRLCRRPSPARSRETLAPPRRSQRRHRRRARPSRRPPRTASRCRRRRRRSRRSRQGGGGSTLRPTRRKESPSPAAHARWGRCACPAPSLCRTAEETAQGRFETGPLRTTGARPRKSSYERGTSASARPAYLRPRTLIVMDTPCGDSALGRRQRTVTARLQTRGAAPKGRTRRPKCAAAAAAQMRPPPTPTSGERPRGRWRPSRRRSRAPRGGWPAPARRAAGASRASGAMPPHAAPMGTLQEGSADCSCGCHRTQPHAAPR